MDDQELFEDEHVFYDQFPKDDKRKRQIMKIWRRIVDIIIRKDPNWGKKCQDPDVIGSMDRVQKVMWNDFCLRMQQNPKLVTIPKGVEFNHTTPCVFAHGRKYPYSMFNFYAHDPVGFEQGGVTYFYKTKRAIPNVVSFEHIDTDAEDILEQLDSWFKEWDPTYVTNSEEFEKTGDGVVLLDDYRPSAYVCQVLGWNGIIFEPEVNMLCGNGSKWFKFIKMRKNQEDVKECKDYSGEKFARGANSVKNPIMGQHYFEKEDALSRRSKVRTRSQFYANSEPVTPYYDISRANVEEEEESD